MELIENKLNSNNPILVSQVISSIVQNIKNKKGADVTNLPELKFLQEKCINDDPLISETACQGVIYLVEENILDIDVTLSDFITKIPYTKCFLGLTRLFGKLLILELERKISLKQEIVCCYNLRVPQHPFVTLLHQHSNSSTSILNEIKSVYISEDEKMAIYANKLFRPIYLYTICNPGETDLNYFKEQLWRFLICSNNLKEDFFLDILSWLPVQTKNNLLLISDLLNETINNLINNQIEMDYNLIILWQTSILYHMIIHKYDVRTTVYNIRRIIRETQHVKVSSCLILMLSKVVPHCSPIHLEDLLNLCKLIITTHKCDIFATLTLKASLLHLIANTTLLNSPAITVCNTIYTHIENNKTNVKLDTEFCNKYSSVLKSNKEVYLSIKLWSFSGQLTSTEKIMKFLETLKNVPQFFVKTIIHFLFGIFLLNKNTDIELEVFSIILNCSKIYPSITPDLLSLILYKISKTKETDLHLALLKALPDMVILKENYQKILATLLALSKGVENLQNLTALLMHQIWKKDEKIYTYLENILTVWCQKKNKNLETDITRAFILKEICEQRPEKYGKEIVAHFSNILNKCTDEDEAVPCALAIDGITVLCKAEVIDAITTWANLAPKYKSDIRVPIVKSLCNLIHEIPQLSYSESYPQLIDDIIQFLWQYVENTNDPDIMGAALNAMTSFSVEQISIHIPDAFLDPDMLEAKLNSVVGAPRTVPGKTWVHLMKCLEGNLRVVGDFLIKMISNEIADYLKYVYQVKSNSEPLNFAYLPTSSIVRGIGEYLKPWLSSWRNKDNEAIFLECLRIFSQDYVKPLPPYNWNFLVGIMDAPQARGYCIDLASKQVILSGSARNIMENLVEISSKSENEEDMLSIYRNLKHLANSLQPIILRPFFENTIKIAVAKFLNENNDELLQKIFKHLQEVLQNKKILDINKTTIAEVLNAIVNKTDVSSPLFEILLDCISVFPHKYIDMMTLSKNQAEVTWEWFEKSVIIRCTVSKISTESVLVWLDDLVDVVCTNKIKGASALTFEHFVPVFQKHVETTDCALWLLDLLGSLQAKVVDRCHESQLVYLFDLFILAVVGFSGLAIFVDDYKTLINVEMYELFPQALVHLLDVNHWSICTSQALEWLYYMNMENHVPEKYRNIFGITLQSLRHEDEFTKNLKWMKYINCKVITTSE